MELGCREKEREFQDLLWGRRGQACGPLWGRGRAIGCLGSPADACAETVFCSMCVWGWVRVRGCVRACVGACERVQVSLRFTLEIWGKEKKDLSLFCLILLNVWTDFSYHFPVFSVLLSWSTGFFCWSTVLAFPNLRLFPCSRLDHILIF